ncbi:hypothetical protein [Cohnella thermotolerans]
MQADIQMSSGSQHYNASGQTSVYADNVYLWS